jgi:hypothetical protein
MQKRNKAGQAMKKADVKVRRTMSVPEAGLEYFNLSRNASYEAAKRGEIPTIKIGGRIRAVVAALDRMLERAGNQEKRAEVE